jgi:hypothetical protein
MNFERIQGICLAIKLLYLMRKVKKLLEGNLELMKENRLLREEAQRLEDERRVRLWNQKKEMP